MLKRLRESSGSQLFIAFLIGIGFGFSLNKGGLTRFDIIIGQLLFEDFTVIKVMMSAIATGMIGVYAMKSLGWVTLSPKPGSVGSTVIGGLIFGVGFGLLGYCPGIVVGAVAHGALDALFGGMVGMLIGSAIFAALFPKLNGRILRWGSFGNPTFPDLLKVNPWVVVVPFAGGIFIFLYWLESVGL
jgi:hypothetical protein